MELPNKFLEQIAFKTRPKNEEHMLVVMDKITFEEHLSQPLQSNNKQFILVVNFPTGCDGCLNVTNNNIKRIFISIFEGAESNLIRIPPRAYDLAS